jgi:hypothetical protein
MLAEARCPVRRSLPGFGLLVLSALTTAACDSTVAFTATGPAPLSANVNVSGSFGIEPSIVRPEQLPGSCGAHSPFGLRLGVTVRGGDDVILRSVRFVFEDRDGRRALPEVTALPSLSSPLPAAGALPSSSPVTVPGNAPLPTTGPIPIPGATPITGVLVPAGSDRRFTFFLQFTCLVFPQGDVVVVIDSARGGRFETTELRVRVD